MFRLKSLVVATVLGFASVGGPLHAAATDAPLVAPGVDNARVQSLLDRAEAHLRDHGDQALAGFSRAGEFQDGDLYVYVIDMDGNFLASGGASTTLIGRNVTDLSDSSGRRFIREILDGARTRASGRVEYRWRNPIRGGDEPKIATYRRVGERILVVGAYVPHASFELAKSLVWRAVHELKANGEGAFARFNSLNGGFAHDDLYVFVIGLDDEIMHANGGHPRLVGRKSGDLVDTGGRHFVRDMLALARTRGEGEVRYTWRNPVTQKVENKRSYIVRVGNYLVGAGAYGEGAR